MTAASPLDAIDRPHHAADHDVIIIGGSFAGVSAAMQLARARRRVLLIDAGQPRNRFVENAHGFLGQDGRPPREIIGTALTQLSAYPTFSFRAGQALQARKHGDLFKIDLGKNGTARGRRLILATGVGDDLPEIAGMRERWGLSIFSCPYCHGYEVADRRLGVIANHPMSAHQAVLVSDWGPTVYFTQGRFEPDEELLPLFHARNIEVKRSPIVEILGSGTAIETVRSANGLTVPVEAVFTAPRTRLTSPLAEQLGCRIEDGPLGPLISVDDQKRTSIEGVFAAGDVTSMMANATMASAAGVMAGVSAHRSLVFDNATHG
ncbi:NAD(P)/FAD-dependent oxidoreductase [Labrys sp. KNU-23]|uniref:NAD(P)/FAD-dependent oxidoreductase n=1 Tax=Labrys sp. KNU-23 TaxID=2789216 RepID=UPI0011EECB08|nr:NAD(P)/FAD-dependent oxidoreductase [Labrys sp. KNU-23]QEN85421.1 NAD(P)/FAD-dependent oxidoreductase [Labrys sp. KNU-23]